MKNKGLIITLMILVLLIIFGLIIFLCLVLSGRLDFKFNSMNWGAKKSEQVIFDTSYELEEIEKLEILSTAGDISFEESTDEKIRVMVYGENSEDLVVEFSENDLKIDYSKYKQKNILFGFNFYSNNIIIYLPKEYGNEISIKANYGDIKAIDLENVMMRIEADCGDITLGKVRDVSIKSEFGDVKIDSILKQANIELSCGDVRINSMNMEENSSIINNFGDIKIGQTNEVYIDAKTDFGDLKLTNNYRYSEITLKIKNNCGDIKIEN